MTDKLFSGDNPPSETTPNLPLPSPKVEMQVGKLL